MEQHTSKSTSPETSSSRLPADDGNFDAPTDAFRDAVAKLAELKSYVSYYAAAKADQFKTSIRNLVLYAGLGIVGALVAVTALVMGVAIFCLGLAYALSAAFEHAWAGFLLAGFLIVALIGAGAFVGYILVTRAARKRMVAKYEQLQYEQQLQFGTNVRQRSAEVQRD